MEIKKQTDLHYHCMCMASECKEPDCKKEPYINVRQRFLLEKTLRSVAVGAMREKAPENEF